MTESSRKHAQQLAKEEVENTYPDVLRDEEHLRTHAFAVAEQQVHDTITAGRDDFAVQHFAEAFMTAYRRAVEERDAGQ